MPGHVWYYEIVLSARHKGCLLPGMGDEAMRDWDLLHKFEIDLMKRQAPDPVRSLHIVEAMYDEARHFGVFPLGDPLEGLEIDLKIARVVNLVPEDTHEDS